MNFFRQSVLSRLVALTLGAGLALWTGVPLASAQPEVAAANVARTHAAGPIESAIAEALAAAAQSPDPAEAFEEVLLEALEARNAGAALVDLLDAGGSLGDVLDLLVGALWQNGGLPLPVPASVVPSTSPVAGTSGALIAAKAPLLENPDATPREILPSVPSPETDVSIRILSSAQPLGP